jgi:hypothetical protein
MKNRLKSKFYINNEGIKIGLFTDYSTIKKEFEFFGIETKNKTFEEVLQNLKSKINYDCIEEFKSVNNQKLLMLESYIHHLCFYTYNFYISKMPTYLKKEFDVFKDFSSQFRNTTIY